MAENKKNRTILFLSFLLPLIALITLGVSSYLWYKALKPEIIPPPVIMRSKIDPEGFSAGLKENLKKVMSDFGVKEADINFRKADAYIDGIHHIYTVKVPENASLALINLKITTMTKDLGGSVFRGIEGSNGRTLTVTLGTGKTPTDVVIFKKIPGIELKRAKMAIIIDDVGIKNLNSAEKFCSLEQVVTLSILPFQPYTDQVVELAIETETPYMLHMPMEPKSSWANPGEGVILVADEKSIITQKLKKAFRSVRGADGLNNHMGSKATENIRTMEIVMEFLSSKNYFFVDSKTSLNSIAYRISNKAGVKSAVIDGFLDVSNDQTAIEKKLDSIAEQAFKNGMAIAICHDKTNTLAVLERKLPELEKKGIKFVKVSDMIR